ncbi:MAG: hypothetical protein H0V44_04150 [Planctomycetes bacterium]|nr:hypothetical protein [Planctomycetota bacterium]
MRSFRYAIPGAIATALMVITASGYGAAQPAPPSVTPSAPPEVDLPDLPDLPDWTGEVDSRAGDHARAASVEPPTPGVPARTTTAGSESGTVATTEADPIPISDDSHGRHRDSRHARHGHEYQKIRGELKALRKQELADARQAAKQARDAAGSSGAVAMMMTITDRRCRSL